MKTSFLFAAVILISTTSFAQSSANTDAKAGAQASVNTHAVSSTSNKAEQGTKKTVKTANSTKKDLEEQSKNDANTAKKASEQDAKASAISQTELYSNTTVKNNNSGKDASLNGQSYASESSSVHMSAQGFKSEGEKTEQSTAHTAVKTKESAKTSVQSAHAKVEAKGKMIKKAIQPRPASVRVSTHISTAAGIKIK